MDAILLTITAIALALAAGMAVLLGRVLRDERRRSDARVALLAELAGDTEPADAPFDVPVPSRSSRSIGLDDLDVRATSETAVNVQGLFDDQRAPSTWPRRLAVIGGMGAIVVALGFGWSHLSAAFTVSAPATFKPQTRSQSAPLELLSMRHIQDEGALTVTGIVQNPREGKTLSGVKVTLFVFGPGGSFITSGRAPLDYTSLAPGDESPFLVRVPVAGDIARYRIGFRGDDDRVLAHIDRRSADSLAQKQDP